MVMINRLNAQLTVQQLVNQYKIVLDVLLGDLAEVRLHHFDDLQQELEHHRGVDILLRHSRQPDVRSLQQNFHQNSLHFRPQQSHLNVEETRPGDVRNRRPHLLTRMDHINPKSIHRVPSNIIAINTGDENLAFVVVHEQTTNHLSSANFRSRSGKRFETKFLLRSFQRIK